MHEKETGNAPPGRWPSHLVLSHSPACRKVDGSEPEAWDCCECCSVRLLDEQSGDVGGGFVKPYTRISHDYYSGSWPDSHGGGHDAPGSGGASRFFYCAKPSTSERDAGLDHRNRHPTVKSVELMRWLIRLITPPKGKVLDPFGGTMTTGMACVYEDVDFVGIEQDEQSAEDGRARIRYAIEHDQPSLL